jgi:predicted enzyme related to lactoylglutathione lyase
MSDPQKLGSLVWFEVPANDPAKIQKFYSELFGWKVNPIPGMQDYWHFDTGGPDDTPDGGLIRRKHERQPITAYFAVASVLDGIAKVEKLGGTVCIRKTAVPSMGYFAICRDTDGNEFALWEMDQNAK